MDGSLLPHRAGGVLKVLTIYLLLLSAARLSRSGAGMTRGGSQRCKKIRRGLGTSDVMSEPRNLVRVLIGDESHHPKNRRGCV